MERRTFLTSCGRAAAAVVAAGAGITLRALPAFADEWCEVDPPIYVKVASGETVVLHVTIYARGVQHLGAIERAKISHWSVPNRRTPTNTDVAVKIFVPDDRYARGFDVRSVVSSGEFATGTIFGEDAGKSGRDMDIKFTLTPAQVRKLPKANDTQIRVGTFTVGPTVTLAD